MIGDEDTNKPKYIELVVPDCSYWPFISTVLTVNGYIVDYKWVNHGSTITETGEPDPYYGQNVRHIIGRLKVRA